MTYFWNFGDGNSSTLTDPTNAFTTTGNYNSKLVVSSLNGCKDSITQNIQVYPTPNANFIAPNGCENSLLNYTNTSSISNGSLTYQWTIPTFGTSNSINQSHSYTTAGFYDVELIAISGFGCKDTIEQTTEVFAIPVVVINGGGATCGSSSNLWVTNPGTYFWSNGSTNDSIVANFNGNYDVTVTSPDGCIGNGSTAVTLNSAVTPILGPVTAACDSLVLDAGYAGSTFSWTGTGVGVNDINQTFTVNTTGTNSYSVTVTDGNGCIGTDNINVTISTSTPITINAIGGPIACDGNIVTLDPGTTTGNVWSTTETTSTIDVITSGSYSIIHTNAASCTSTADILITFNPLPFVDLGPTRDVCDSITLHATNPGATYSWNGAPASCRDSLFFVNTLGLNQIDVTVTSGNGCFDQDTVDITINASPIINLGNDTTICSYDSIILDAGLDGGIPFGSYSWTGGTTAQTFNVFATGTYSVNVVDANLCSGADEISITVNPIFNIDLGQDYNLCIGANSLLQSGYAGGSYNWQDNSGSIGVTQNILVSDTGKYWVDVIDVFGCETSDTITLSPTNLSLFAEFLVQSTVRDGDSVKFVNLSYPRPYDSYWDFDNGFVSQDSAPIQQFFNIEPILGDTSFYDVKLIVTNSQCIDSLIKQVAVPHPGVKDLKPEIVEDLTLYNEIEEVNLFPNPNDGNFNLYVKLKEVGNTELMVFNLMGQLVQVDEILLQENTLQYNLNTVQPGMYILRIRVRESVKTIKFIITH